MRFHLALALLVALAGCASTSRTTPSAARALDADSVSARRIADGVMHRRLVISREPWIVQVIEVDLRRRELSLRAEHALGRLEGRERTSSIARRVAGDSLEVIAAVNADFFNLRTGEATNNQVVEGALVTGLATAAYGARPPRSHFATTLDGRPLIERFTLRATLRAGQDSVLLAGINVPPPPNSVVLRRWPAPDTLPRDSLDEIRALALHAVGTTGRRFVVRGSPAGAREARLPSGGGLLVARGEGRATLDRLAHSRDTLELSGVLTPERGTLRTVVGGWTRLLANGVIVGDTATEGAAQSFIESRHPRTAVGFSRDSSTLYLVVIDGRQPRSAGTTIGETARVMRGLGAWDAVNLDGGGSTTLVVRDTILNSPSDAGGERTVGNALLLVRPIRRR